MHRYIQFSKYGASFKSVENKGFHSFSSSAKLVSKVNCFSHPCQLSKYLLSPFSSEHIFSHSFNNHFTQVSRNLVNSLEKYPETKNCISGEDHISTDHNLKKDDDVDLFSNIDYEQITGGDSESLNKFKLLLLEFDVLRQDGMRVPKQMSTDHWKELISLETRSRRIKFLSFLWTVEIKKLNDIRRKEKRKLANIEKKCELMKQNENNNHILYGFQGSTIFLRVYETTMNMFDNSRLVQAMKFGQDIVIDCSYYKQMSKMENKLCAKQLMLLFGENRVDKEPFNLHFCNMSRSDNVLFERFQKFIPTIDDPCFPINLTEEHYLNLFPKEKLVYLTPHCRTELTEFSHDDIYIIGALVDKQINEPLSLAKAKSEGIRMAKLPLDRYLSWNLGTKSLTVNQVLQILLTIRTTGDWNVALKHVPQRKLRHPDEPIQDRRKFYYRGTTYQPPPLYRGNKGYSIDVEVGKSFTQNMRKS